MWNIKTGKLNCGIRYNYYFNSIQNINPKIELINKVYDEMYFNLNRYVGKDWFESNLVEFYDVDYPTIPKDLFNSDGSINVGRTYTGRRLTRFVCLSNDKENEEYWASITAHELGHSFQFDWGFYSDSFFKQIYANIRKSEFNLISGVEDFAECFRYFFGAVSTRFLDKGNYKKYSLNKELADLILIGWKFNFLNKHLNSNQYTTDFYFNINEKRVEFKLKESVTKYFLWWNYQIIETKQYQLYKDKMIIINQDGSSIISTW